jgi:hypothetical protein
MQIKLQFNVAHEGEIQPCPVIENLPIRKMIVAEVTTGSRNGWCLQFGNAPHELFQKQSQGSIVDLEQVSDRRFFTVTCGCEHHTDLSRLDGLQICFERPLSAGDEVEITYFV